MSDTIFDKRCFDNSSLTLYERVLDEGELKLQTDAIDNFDRITGLHSRGVAQMVAQYVTSGIIKLDLRQSENAVRVAILHDGGKLNVGTKILNKDGPLNQLEWVQIREHPIEGFHRYASRYGAYEALPILIHHIFQLNNYPSRRNQELALAEYGLPPAELDSDETLIIGLMLAVADHFEARYPIVKTTILSDSIRTYDQRQYSVESLPLLVRASFVEAGKVKKLNMTGLLDALISCSQQAFRKMGL